MDSISVKLIQRKALIADNNDLWNLYLKEKKKKQDEAARYKRAAESADKWKEINTISEQQNCFLQESLDSQKQETKKARCTGLLWFGGGVVTGFAIAGIISLTH